MSGILRSGQNYISVSFCTTVYGEGTPRPSWEQPQAIITSTQVANLILLYYYYYIV